MYFSIKAFIYTTFYTYLLSIYLHITNFLVSLSVISIQSSYFTVAGFALLSALAVFFKEEEKVLLLTWLHTYTFSLFTVFTTTVHNVLS